jgi:dTDP-4-dehydrorhamnose reductase
MITNAEALELVSVINDNWTNSPIRDKAVAHWVKGFVDSNFTYEQLIVALNKAITIYSFRPTISDICEIVVVVKNQPIVTELTDWVPLQGVGSVVTKEFNLRTGETRDCTTSLLLGPSKGVLSEY